MTLLLASSNLLLDSSSVALAPRASSTSSASSDQPEVVYPICYIKNVDVVKTGLQDRPCGPTNATNPYVSCCVEGDTCLEDGMCYAPDDFDGTAGYYIGGCTDANYEDPACKQHCCRTLELSPILQMLTHAASQPFPQIVYESSSSNWACCFVDPDSNAVECDRPTNETWSAPGPEKIETIATPPLTTWITSLEAVTSSVGTTETTMTPGSTTSLTSSSPSSTKAATSASPTPGPSSYGLSPGAKGGIAIGVIAGAALIGVLAWVLLRRRNWKKEIADSRGARESAYEKPELPSESIVRDGYKPLVELSSGRDGEYLHELPVDTGDRR
ncbi:MAG: hypothetical protein M1820_009301 [Bogoriella megaspora]|nr:MAG: hypothetical protein M1820_009301 [Bogoriella megaspora]